MIARAVLGLGVFAAPMAAMASGIKASDGWTPAGGTAGGEAPLYMTIANDEGTPDQLLRVRCPVALFSEKRVTELGEGAPATREIKTIAVPASGSVTLAPGAQHVALLQLAKPLAAGDTFTCSLSFAHGGATEIAVTVR